MTNHLLALPSFLAARSISIYLSTPTSEIQTDLIIRRAFEMGKHLYVPFCPVGEREVMMMLRLESVDHFEGLGLNRWGIRDLDPTTVGMLEDGTSPSLTHQGRSVLMFSECSGRLGEWRVGSHTCPRVGIRQDGIEIGTWEGLLRSVPPRYRRLSLEV